MSMSKACGCGRPMTNEDARTHGVCFGCKIGTINFGSVPNLDGESYASQDRENLALAAAKGVSVGTGTVKDQREAKKKAGWKRPKKVQELYDRG